MVLRKKTWCCETEVKTKRICLSAQGWIQLKTSTQYFFSLKSFYDAAEVVNHSNAREGKKRGSPKKILPRFRFDIRPEQFWCKNKKLECFKKSWCSWERGDDKMVPNFKSWCFVWKVLRWQIIKKVNALDPLKAIGPNLSDFVYVCWCFFRLKWLTYLLFRSLGAVAVSS